MKLDTVYYDDPNKRYIFIFKTGHLESAWYVTDNLLENNPDEAARQLKKMLEWYKNGS